MHVLLVYHGNIPVQLYGGIERVTWALGKELVKLGHKVTFLVNRGSYCDFADVIYIDTSRSIVEQIKGDFDIVHFMIEVGKLQSFRLPYIITCQTNINNLNELDENTVFCSKNHAERHNSETYVHNCLDWDEYVTPDLNAQRNYFHFLGLAAWRVKNVQGAIDVIKKTKTERLRVLGGVRFNVKMGIRFTFSPKIRFMGMVGGEEKCQLLNGSKGLIFPVRWHEPFGLAIIESLYYGCPVFGTPYGSLPELVTEEVGFLSNKKDELAEAVLNSDSFSPARCQEYVRDNFSSRKMATEYLAKYEKVLSSEPLNATSPRLKEVQQEKFLEWS